MRFTSYLPTVLPPLFFFFLFSCWFMLILVNIQSAFVFPFCIFLTLWRVSDRLGRFMSRGSALPCFKNRTGRQASVGHSLSSLVWSKRSWSSFIRHAIMRFPYACHRNSGLGRFRQVSNDTQFSRKNCTPGASRTERLSNRLPTADEAAPLSFYGLLAVKAVCYSFKLIYT